jgi:hypothetical protein
MNAPAVVQCSATITLPSGTTLRCKWHAGHAADGSHIFAFHGQDYGRALAVWKDEPERALRLDDIRAGGL